MDIVQQVTAEPRGARFYRVDLHIHSFGSSHDVKDPTMTPQAIVEMAVAEGLGVIAITDHNEITNVSAAVTAVGDHPLLVIPAVELSTPQGHLLCYLPSLDSLQKFYASLDIVGRGTPESRCQNALLDCMNHLHQLGGFGVLAHVDTNAGFEHEVPGGSPHKVDILCHPALLGVEVKFG